MNIKQIYFPPTFAGKKVVEVYFEGVFARVIHPAKDIQIAKNMSRMKPYVSE